MEFSINNQFDEQCQKLTIARISNGMLVKLRNNFTYILSLGFRQDMFEIIS